ncbi:acyl-CoA dehydrogenase family protein [Geodermatophilus sabuli]|uniref:Acyl-CoA dehydrogenase n=1 Tax=Geodermatophilus sabuli TaxID=1564158 RepID=A0A285E6N8_9ACTN|nr:acyl-CoA dehydrogenase family protein [Geodermatophilus sabuli]MBB3082500.1 alkylation response protein AidB-like acyl-CoA dehydrogenase [Geodermatophilus sabuli]SNX94630.1 Acyl-CoA dehydrogenase [Geodermatophilus sabuli]
MSSMIETPVKAGGEAEATDLVHRTREFIRSEVLPVDDRFDGDVTRAGGDDLRRELQEGARRRGLLAPHAPVELGGLGLSMTQRARVFEEAGYSLFGAMAINAAAPDEGNTHLLAHVATPAQREQFAAPLVRGEVRSAFAMTEPAPGAGSDPSALATRATRVSGGWRIDGGKIFITGADGAGFFIIMARTSGDAGDRGGGTMFLAPAGTSGLRIGRHVPTMDRSMVGGHCEVAFDGLVVPDEAVLGEVDEGFRYAQVRLGPARMTHVMRWLGAALRAHEVAVEYAVTRRAFGAAIADSGLAQQLIADNEIDLAAARSLLDVACAALDAGSSAAQETSIAKTFGAEAIGRVVDRAMQLCGGMGVSADLPIARIAREVRPFRIYDGPSEVHRFAIAKRAAKAARARVGS